MNHKKIAKLLLVPLLIVSPITYSATVSKICYEIGITTSYAIGSAACGVNGCAGDTGILTFTNNGTSVFTGNLGAIGIPGDLSNNVDTTQYNVTLTPGQSIILAMGDESSNHKGFNGTNGLLIFISGVAKIQKGSKWLTAYTYKQIFDKDIHSGSPKINPFNYATDAYVLEGGDPTRDTGDDYEVLQTPGHTTFSGCLTPN